MYILHCEAPLSTAHRKATWLLLVQVIHLHCEAWWMNHLQDGCTLMPNRFRGVLHLSGPAAALAGHVPPDKRAPRHAGHISTPFSRLLMDGVFNVPFRTDGGGRGAARSAPFCGKGVGEVDV
ncbi:hypothetical protein CDAR_394221 [Caerostris darwini]|uniref:Uncharacterized protein n=1 Tax=Caerostris darwini TaxID=1538125 RepID=A0AAV4RG89_9ARAC|nr:hypothetical protein CDAR_394221 [Caerostris darwini]